MFLPIGDLPNPPGKSYVNTLLIVINVAVFVLVTLPLTTMRPDPADPLLLDYLQRVGVQTVRQAQSVMQQISAYDLFVYRHGFKPADPSWANLFSALFLHGGVLHLAGNMLFLWIFGDNVEYRLGAVRYLLLYLFTGVMATLFFALFFRTSQIPLIGASGAISGIIGCYFVWFPRNKVKTFVFLFPLIMNSFYLPARLVLGIYLVVDNLVPFLFMRSGGGVAHGAHIGGFIAGAAVAYGIDHLPGLRRGHQLRRPSSCAEVAQTVGEEIACLIERQQLAQAVGIYFTLKGREQRLQLDARHVLKLGHYLLGQGEYDAALAVFRRFIAERPTDSALDQACLGAGKALLNKENCLPSAHQYFLAALDVSTSEGVAEEARLHLRSIEQLGRAGSKRR